MTGTARRGRLGVFAAVLTGVVLVTACASGSGTPPASAAAPVRATTGPTCAPGQIGPLSASFVSASTGFLLGRTLSHCGATSSSRIVLRKTTDGGSRWSALTAPGGSVSGGRVSAIVFANARDGWAYGPDLWATHDGGRTWHRLATHGETGLSMATTGGYVLAGFLNCDPQHCHGPGTFTVESSPVGRDAWRPVPGATGLGVPALTAVAGTATVIPDDRVPFDQHVRLLTGPADGSARWVSRDIPCYPGTIALSAPTASRRVLACATLGAHPALTHLYASGDAGRSWTPVTTIGLFDGASTVEQTRDGTLLVAGIYDGVELSRNGGRTWAQPAAIDSVTGGGGTITADLYTSSDGYVIVSTDGGVLWVTRNDRTWTRVTVR